MKKIFIIGIAGGSGSGKSTFAKRLQEYFPDEIALIRSDNYYLAHDDIPLEKRKLLNYDSPEALEFDLMAEQVRLLKSGFDIDCPKYDFSTHTRTGKFTHIKAKPIIILDGILIFSDAELRNLMDLKIYVETDADERILRRAKRDIYERGRDLDNIIEQYLTTVKPMHNKFVEPTKIYADLIINGGLNDTAFDVVKTKIEKILQGTEKRHVTF